MTRLLQEAIEHLRQLPDEEQDSAADVLFAYIASDERQYHLAPHQIAEVRRIKQTLRAGHTRLATETEVDEARKKGGA